MVNISQKQEQKQQLSPQQILQASLLQLTLPLLEQRILHELEINPALELSELNSENEEVPEEKLESEDDIEFDWEELLGINDDYEFPKTREKQNEEGASSLISNSTPSISKRNLNCFVRAFFGSVRILTRDSSSNS